jgi:hypothetical protein
MKILISVAFFVTLTVLVIQCSNAPKTDKTIIGKELAEASMKENENLDSNNVKSPLLNFSYSKFLNEQSLINPKLNELDSLIIKLCEKFKNSNDSIKNEIRKSIRQNDIYTLLQFTQRTTVFSIRRKEAIFLEDGFIAISMIEAERCDYRDVLVALSFLDFGITKLNLNETKMFHDAVILSEPKTANLIRQFSQRSTKDKSLEEVAGYKAVETPNGITFMETE